MRTQLINLRPGTRFRVPETGQEAELVQVNLCRARVKVKQPEKDVTITDKKGRTRSFKARPNKFDNWTPFLVVETNGGN